MRLSFNLCFLLLICSAGQCQSVNIRKVEFTTLTRGYQKQVFISQDSVVEIVDGRQEDNKITKRSLSKSEWDSLVKAIQSVDLKEVPALQSPTSRRAFDGARHSSIRISDADGKQYEHSFDDESPHPNLKPLMDAILSIQSTPPR
jgi:hypothetical protein